MNTLEPLASKKKNGTADNILILAILLLLAIPVFYFLSFQNLSGLSKIAFWINFLLCCFGILSEKSRGFSLYKMSFYFVLIFFVLSPLSQLHSDYYPWGLYYDSNIVVRSNLLITVFSLILLFVKKFAVHKKPTPSAIHLAKPSKVVDQIAFIVFLAVLAIIQLFLGFNNVFIRHGFEFKQGTIFDIAIDYFLKAFPCFYYCYLKSFSKSKLLKRVVFLSALLINNPLSNNRFLSLAAYCGLFCVAFEKIRKNGIFDLLVVGGIIVIFPLFSQFKFLGQTNVFNFTIDFSSVLNAADFDAYAMLCHTIKYVDVSGVLNGKQILSSLFFFVPRALLPIKGDISGAVVITFFNPDSYSNVSCPLIAEGLIDFGILGAILYSLVFAWITCAIDKRVNMLKPTLFSKVYFFLFGYWIFVLRGSLAPTILRLFGFLLPYIVFSITRLLKKSTNKAHLCRA